jgi:hypothetical protein
MPTRPASKRARPDYVDGRPYALSGKPGERNPYAPAIAPSTCLSEGSHELYKQ